MDHVIAKMRQRGNTTYKKLLSEVKIYQTLHIANSVKYSPDTLLEDLQWYVIENFSNEDYCISLLKDDWDSTIFDPGAVDINKIDYICSYQDENYYFQRVQKSYILKNKSFLGFGDEVVLEKNQNRIAINELPDAFYNKSQDALYFKKLETISPIFKGIEIIYREATNKEVDEFLDKSFIKCEEKFGTNKVGKANRHRLAVAMDILSRLDKGEKKQLFKYVDEYYPELGYNGKKFTIKNDEELKKLCWGIDQHCFTTPITKEKRVANSYINL